jgi:signal transduction histidine kinase
LSIVKAIAVAHGGDVRAERRAGEGTAFSILLPVAPPAQDHEQRGQ